MKAEILTEPVKITYPGQQAAEAKDESEEIIAEAQRASERIRRAALQAAEKERMAARTEAERLVQKAKAEHDKVLQEAREQGKAEGEQSVLQEFRPRIEASVADFEDFVRSVEVGFNECLEKHKGELVELAVRIAERVILRRSEEDRNLVYRTACAALEKARERHEVTIFVNPLDLAVLEEFQTELVARFDDLKVVRFEVDRRVDRGGVRIETPSGLIDARIRTQVDEIIKSLIPEESQEKGLEE